MCIYALCVRVLLTYVRIHTGLQIGCRVHYRVPASSLNVGPSSRRGRHVAMRSRCASCYAQAPVPEGGGSKIKMSNGDNIPSVTYACNVCRVLLCQQCFWHVYDHRKCGLPSDSLHLR